MPITVSSGKPPDRASCARDAVSAGRSVENRRGTLPWSRRLAAHDHHDAVEPGAIERLPSPGVAQRAHVDAGDQGADLGMRRVRSAWAKSTPAETLVKPRQLPSIGGKTETEEIVRRIAAVVFAVLIALPAAAQEVRPSRPITVISPCARQRGQRLPRTHRSPRR